MTHRRTLITALLSAALAASALATLPGIAQAQDKIVMKAADVHPAGYPNVVAIENMGKKLSAATHGRISFQMFPGSVLGGEKEMIEQTQVGAIQILRTSLAPLGPVVPEVNVFNMPFVFRDEAQMAQRVPWDKRVADHTSQLKAGGVEFISIDNKAFYDATAPVRA